jgi:alpha-N-arabinofuranosidase
LVAATSLDIFNRHADKVVMANIAQTINVLQAMILTQGDKMVVTPTGYVYEMYAPHQDGMSVRTTVDSESLLVKGPAGDVDMDVISGSASVKGNVLFLTLTNAHAADAVEVTVSLLGGARANGGMARVLTGEIHAHNTFDAPEIIKPLTLAAEMQGCDFVAELPAASVAAFEIALA